ncbi:MAG: alpha/beta fold hydrolase [Longimicrobiales bacterium]
MAPELSLSVVRRGQGPKHLVFIHGFGGSRFTWRFWNDRFGPEYTLHLIDLKGFGTSARPEDGRYAPRDLAEEVVRYLIDSGLDDYALVGHSMGGGVALFSYLALKDRGAPLPGSIVLVAAAAYAQVIPNLISLARRPLLGPLLLPIIPARVLTRVGLNAAYHRERTPPAEAIDGYTKGLASLRAKWSMRQVAMRIVPADLEEITVRYRSIAVPTLLVWGRQDRVVPLWVGQRLMRELPDADLVVLEDCGHMPAEEAPEASFDAVERFFHSRWGSTPPK